MLNRRQLTISGLITLGLITIPFLIKRNDIITWLYLTLLYITLAQSWNILGGFTGQHNLGHAAFFGTGALAARYIWIHYGYPLPLAIFGGGMAATIFALIIGFFAETMYDLLIVAFQLLYHVLFFPIILGVYWKKANAPGAVAGMITGFLFIIIWMIIAGTMFPSPEWASTLVPGGVGGLVMVIVSLITQKRRPPQPLYTSDGKVLKFGELAGK